MPNIIDASNILIKVRINLYMKMNQISHSERVIY